MTLAVSGPELPPGRVLKGRYEIRKRLDRGGRVQVCLAQDLQANTECVLKWAPHTPAEARGMNAGLEREAALLRELKHPKIPGLVDCFELPGDPAGASCLVRAYAPGASLAQLLAFRRIFPEQEALQLAAQVAEILAYLHGRSPAVIHRAIHPGNLVLAPSGEVWLLGLGAEYGMNRYGPLAHHNPAALASACAYVPYEQFRGHARPQTDLYALGVTLIALRSRRDPASLERTGLRLAFQPFVDLSPGCLTIIERCTEPDWRKRYQDAGALLHALQARPPAPAQACAPPATQARTPRPARTALLLLLLGGLLLFAGYGHPGLRPLRAWWAARTGPHQPSGVPVPETRGQQPDHPDGTREFDLATLPQIPEGIFCQLPGIRGNAVSFQPFKDRLWIFTTQQVICLTGRGRQQGQRVLYTRDLPEKDQPRYQGSYQAPPSLSAALVDDSGLWIATQSGRLWHRQSPLSAERPWRDLQRESGQWPYTTAVVALAAHAGTVWKSHSGQYALPAGRLARYERHSSRWIAVRAPALARLYAAPSGRFYASGTGRVFCHTPQGWALLAEIPWRTHRGQVPVLFEDAQGALWAGSEDGLLRLAPDGRQTERLLPGKKISALAGGPAGGLWIGTADAGLFLLEGGQLYPYGYRQGLPKDQVAALWGEDPGRLWCGLEGGLLLAAPQAELRSAARSGRLLDRPRGSGDFDGRLTFLGQPVGNFTREAPTFLISPRPAHLLLHEGRFQARGVEATLARITVSYEDGPRYRGDWPGRFKQEGLEVRLPLQADAQFPLEVPLCRFIRLRRPADNIDWVQTGDQAYSDGPFQPPLAVFEWEPLEAGAHPAEDAKGYQVEQAEQVVYRYRIEERTVPRIVRYEVEASGAPVPPAKPVEILGGQTPATRLEVPLQTSKAGTFYSFHLEARWRGQPVGRLIVHRSGEGSGPEEYLGFRVRQGP